MNIEGQLHPDRQVDNRSPGDIEIPVGALADMTRSKSYYTSKDIEHVAALYHHLPQLAAGPKQSPPPAREKPHAFRILHGSSSHPQFATHGITFSQLATYGLTFSPGWRGTSLPVRRHESLHLQLAAWQKHLNL